MKNPVLYGHHLSGHSYKVALLLSLSQTEYEFRHVDISLPRAERSDDFQAVSQYGEVPVLIDDGHAINQSNAILLHIAEQTPNANLIGNDRISSLEWLFWEANRIGFSVSNLRLYLRFKHQPEADEITFLQSRAQDDLERLQKELSNKPFLTGETYSIADVSCCGYLYWLAEAGLDISNWPNIQDWLNRISQLPGWFHPDQMPKKSQNIYCAPC